MCMYIHYYYYIHGKAPNRQRSHSAWVMVVVKFESGKRKSKLIALRSTTGNKVPPSQQGGTLILVCGI